MSSRIRGAAVLVALAVLTISTGLAAGPRPAAAERAGDEVGGVEAYLRRHMADVRAPGLAYAIVRGDRVIDQGAWGIDGDGAPVTTRTAFMLGSTSKSFTAMAVMQLVEAGRVDLDQPVRRYVPWLRLGDESVAARITVRQLLTHTTGLPQIVAQGLTDRYDNSPGGLARSVRDLAAVRPTTAPGGVHQYSDANYMVLGVLVETVTGQAFGDYLRRHVLDPLDMTHSAANEAEASSVGVPPGHRYYFGRPQRFAPPFDTSGVPYGFLAASLDDLTHYLIAQLNDGRYGSATVLSPPGIAQLHSGQVATAGAGRYALGWRESTLDGPGDRIVWHAGGTANSFSHLLLVPGSDLGVVILSNSYSLAMDEPLTSAAFNVARILRGGTPVAGSADPTFGWVLAGLLAVAGLLLAILIWSVARAVRRGTRGTVKGVRRSVGAALGWVAGCAAVALGAAWAVPAVWDGADLTQVLLFAPDIGHAIVSVVALAGAVAVARVGVAAYALTGARRGPTAG